MAEDPSPLLLSPHSQASLLSQTRLAAEDQQLENLFDAYETFCTYGQVPLSWRSLASEIHLAIRAQTQGVQQSPSQDLLIEGFFAAYIHKIGLEQLGYLASDLVIALFHVTHVLAPSQHITLVRKSFSLKVDNWMLASTNGYLTAVRTHLQTLLRPHLDILLRILGDEIMARSEELISYSTQDHPRYNSSAWVPCSNSHHALLLHLDLDLDQDLVKRLEVATADKRPVQRWNFHTRLEPEVQSRRGSILRLLNFRGPQSTLEPIKENGDDHRPGTVAAVEANKKDLDRATWKYSDKRNSKRSSYSDYRSFVTAWTHMSRSSTHGSFSASTNRRSVATHNTTIRTSSIQTFLSGPIDTMSEASKTSSEWSEALRKRNIVPDPDLEDWSKGRGQHAEFSPTEHYAISSILEHERDIGSGATATVDSVRCKRVRLVRKTIRCNRRSQFRREHAVNEIQQLYKAQHAHIVRLVGTYVIEDVLAILTYPCAEWNLKQFLTKDSSGSIEKNRIPAVRKFFGCLANVLDFIHSFPIKHMDIKPANILVRAVNPSAEIQAHTFKVYLTDFGSSRFYPSVEESETDNINSFTVSYAAKEVVNYEPRGLPADIFSMGCVFAEMLDSMVGLPSASLPMVRGARDNQPARPYFACLEKIYEWLMDLEIKESNEIILAVRMRTLEMLSDTPSLRPPARKIADSLRPFHSCADCDRPLPEAFERADFALPPEDRCPNQIIHDESDVS